jgi:valyl-tRNA synthetase
MIDPHFDPSEAEARIYKSWEASGAFRPKSDPKAQTFSIVIPPPNVTGSLHIGHALNNTLQDILARYERMRGKAVLWQPGLDHAGIATQMVVERQLAAGGGNESRASLGRDAFVRRVWEWKAESGGTILTQLKRLGASCDWSRERFTMDPGLSDAVRKVFVQLHKDGLIYRDKRLVNWDPHFETAISDLEVENVETVGTLWSIAYPLAAGEGEGDGEIVVATTRPETMLGDVAVAVHPDDERYKALIGRHVTLPLTGRTIPIIADEHSDPEKGTGAVKITPAHDFNDFKVAKRHDLAPINILTSRAALNENVPQRYRGLDRFEARKLVLQDLEEAGLLRGETANPMVQPTGDRSGVIIEPWLTDQWYVDAEKMAVKAIAAVESGETRFVPESWTQTYYQWMRNIEPWCVSRQLWWGHRIPAWFDEAGTIFVEENEEKARAAARAHHGKDVALKQDEDVLDTWFSSALWPFSTMGWPKDSDDLRRFYPTSTLVTMFDIIFFWVARMMMMGTHFTGKAPFATVVIHSRVVDEAGKKMSKSKGNIIDPTDLIDRFGADALRFTLAIAAGPGRDIRMSDKRVEGYRNFATKLWNVARFCQMNECTLWDAFDPGEVKHTLNRWIVSEAARTRAAVDEALGEHRFDEAAQALYAFVWNVLCDWYVELTKPLLNGEDEDAKAETRQTVAWVLDQALRLLHPFMPFVTEELWDKLSEFGPVRERMLIAEAWPDLPDSLIDPLAAEEVGWVIELVSAIRSVRSEVNVPAGARIPALLIGGRAVDRLRLERWQAEIDRLARLDYSVVAEEAPKDAATFVVGEAVVALPLAGVIDLVAERARLAREIARCGKEIDTVARKLSNPGFIAKAPPEVIEEQRERQAGYEAERTRYEAALARLG